MSFKTFKQWVIQEKTDIFGFDKEIEYKRNNPNDGKPIHRFDLQHCFELLGSHTIGNKEPHMKFIGEVHWGNGPGALRVWCGTGLNVMLEKLNHDLTGEPQWITKKVFQIDQSGYGGFEDAVSYELIKELERIDGQSMDSPSREYEELEKLTLALAGKMKRTAKDVFMFEGIRKVDPNKYVISFGCRGHGAEAQDQSRVLQNQTTVSFNPEAGLIRIWNTNLETPMGKAPKWEIQPSDTDWHFAPTQARDEILETIAVTMRWY